MTDKERMELLNLRKRCERQREEIKRLQAEIQTKQITKTEENEK